MTSATEELRRLLDERGVKYERPEDGTTIYYDSGGNRYTYNVNPDSGWAQLFGYNLTPEQAIAATLGSGTCEPIGEWVDISQTQKVRHVSCSECGYEFGMEEKRTIPFEMLMPVELPNFCQNCGARVEVAR